MHRIAIRETIAVLTCSLTLLAQGSNARGDTESPRVVLSPVAADLVVGPGMNAAGRDLRGCEFVTQNLTGAVFDGCNLYGVQITGCILKGASFRNAIFMGAHVEVGPEDMADFTDATINGVGESGAEGWGQLYGLNLSPSQLISTWSYKNKDLYQCVIYGSDHLGEPVALDLRSADLRQATLGGDLSKCDFTNARIYGAFFGNDSITFEQLASTLDFKQRGLRVRLSIGGKTATALSGKWDFSQISLKGSDLSCPPPDADFTDARIGGCTIRNGLTRPQLYSTTSYKQGNLTGLRLVWSDLSGCDLSGMNLTGCFFSHCKFAGTNFEDAVITDAWFVTDKRTAESDCLSVDQIKSTWNYKHGHMEGIRLPEQVAQALNSGR